jgi:hypothetical protein
MLLVSLATDTVSTTGGGLSLTGVFTGSFLALSPRFLNSRFGVPDSWNRGLRSVRPMSFFFGVCERRWVRGLRC